MTTESESLLVMARKELMRSNADRKHPFRFFWLATQSEFPEIRTVVNRKADPEFNLRFYTDTRSPKVTQILDQPRVSALFYHPKKMIQLRMRGQASLLDPKSPAYLEIYRQILHGPSLKDYTSPNAPGSPRSEAEPTGKTPQVHFSVVSLHALELDVLVLGRESHRRAHYARRGDDWVETIVVP